MMQIELISREIIKPSRPTPDHLRSLQYSLFGYVNGKVLMPLVFFFSPTNNATITISNVLDRLKRSLPETLSMFYPLAGRANDENHIIACNDEGVPYVEAKVVSGTALDDFVHKAKVAQLDLLVPSDGLEGPTSLLLAIQVTSFPCGGVAIGVKMNHVVSDAFSMLMFVKAWATITSGVEDYQELLPRPYFELWNVFPLPASTKPLGVEEQVEPKPEVTEYVRPVAKRFVFSQANLNALRSKYLNTSRGKHDCNLTYIPSLPMILSAFIWSRVRSACARVDKHNNSIPHEVFQAVNIRPKVPSPKESYYFGSVVVNAIAKPPLVLHDNQDDECYDLIQRMREAIRSIIGDQKFIRNIQDGKEDLRFVTEQFERRSKGEIALFGFSNIQSLPVYEADFGWGKPVWVTSATLVYKGLAILIPAGPSSKDDIEAYVNLSNEDMAKLERDCEFVELVSSKTLNAISKL